MGDPQLEQMGILPPMACVSFPRPLLGAGLDPAPWERPEGPVKGADEAPVASAGAGCPTGAHGPPLPILVGGARDIGLGAVGGGTLTPPIGCCWPPPKPDSGLGDDDTKEGGRDEAGLETGEYGDADGDEGRKGPPGGAPSGWPPPHLGVDGAAVTL